MCLATPKWRPRCSIGSRTTARSLRPAMTAGASSIVDEHLTTRNQPSATKGKTMRLELDERAWDRGFEDGEQGKPLQSCPYTPGTTQCWSWISAYIEGKAARYGYSTTNASQPSEKGSPHR